MVTVMQGDCRELLRQVGPGVVDCCVTSPPYYGQRDYGHAGQLGREDTPEEYVENLVQVFGLVMPALSERGTLWLNLGDAYAKHDRHPGLKTKDLMGMPWRVALALREAGWYLRADIIWHKPNVMPQSVTDRPTVTHEYVFLLSKSADYYYDGAAICETQSEHERTRRLREQQRGLSTKYDLARDRANHGQVRPGASGVARSAAARQALAQKGTRNRRSVWVIPNVPGVTEHMAVFPEELARVCIVAGCPMGGMVLDPFCGSGTTGVVAGQTGRGALLFELNPAYAALAMERTAQLGLFA